MSRPYPIPANEKERLEALHQYEVMDSGPEARLDRIAATAARLFHAPIALVSLVDENRQWFKANYGLDVCQTSREFSFCAFAMLEDSPMVVCDARLDGRFSSNPLVTGDLSIRFYVGAPLLSRDGFPLGTLCVIDQVAREYPPQELLDSLTDLAFLVSQQLELRFETTSENRKLHREQEQLERSKQIAEAANQAKSDFLARMSHEIRTPMNLIMGMNALLLESPLNDKQRQHVEISYRNVRRLLRLINGILDLSKVEAGDLNFQSVPFNLAELLKESEATISAAIERKHLKLNISMDANVWPYWVGDPERLQQVLLNLIGNAIKFTSRGEIDVRVNGFVETAGAGEPPLELPKGLRFEVNDTGCGVPREKAAEIFEAFHQGEESMSRSYEGTGLGLTIAKTLVEKMGGTIWLEEKPEAGARFVFTVFLAAAKAEDVKEDSGSESIGKTPLNVPEGMRILLVEDNPENVVLIQAYFESLKVEIDLACHGGEAVEKNRQKRYDLVLMDIQMPVMDGYTATGEIRKWEATQNLARVPIVALTAHAFGGAMQDSARAGCDLHLTKPVERRELLEVVVRFAPTREADTKLPIVTPTNIPEAILARRPVYLQSRKTDLETMRSALAHGSFAVIQSIGHNCKGTGAGYGFPQISHAGLAIEKAARLSDPTKVKESIDLLEECVRFAAQI